MYWYKWIVFNLYSCPFHQSGFEFNVIISTNALSGTSKKLSLYSGGKSLIVLVFKKYEASVIDICSFNWNEILLTTFYIFYLLNNNCLWTKSYEERHQITC